MSYLIVGLVESFPSQHQKCLSAWPPVHPVPWHKLYSIHTLNTQTLQIHSHRYWWGSKYNIIQTQNINTVDTVLVNKYTQDRMTMLIIYYFTSVFSPSWYSVRTPTTDTAGTVPSTVTTHCADHALIQFPFMHAWLTHHALLFLLL